MKLHEIALTSFNRHLEALSKILDKAKALAAEKKFDESILVNARLAPDMFALARQIQIAADFAKGCAARLSASEIPKYEDSEKTIDELKARIEKTRSFINGIDVAKYEGCETRSFKATLGGNERDYTGASFLAEAAFPHFYFHIVTSYAILRAQGVNVGKLDYMNA
jgi:uncharacterized protein